MTVINKEFYLKGNLDVAGNATFKSNVILNEIPIKFDNASNKMQIFVNEAWLDIAMLSDLNTQVSYSALPDVSYNGETY